MRFIVFPARDGTTRWVWELIDGETGQVFASGHGDTPADARGSAKWFRNFVSLAPIEMAT